MLICTTVAVAVALSTAVSSMSVCLSSVCCRAEDEETERSDHRHTSATRPALATRPTPATPGGAAAYIPTEDEIDSLAKIGMPT